MSETRVFLTVREALHATATSGKISMKALAGELDWSPSELSMRTTLGGDSARPFPADDDHLVRLMKITGDFSVLATVADLCGYELAPKKERQAEMIVELQRDAKQLGQRIQMLLEIPGLEYRPERAEKGRTR